MCLYSNLPPLCATLETEVMKEEEGEEEVGEEEVGEEEWEESVVESPALAPDFSGLYSATVTNVLKLTWCAVEGEALLRNEEKE